MQKYSVAIRVLHWVVAILLIMLLVVGLIMADMPKENPLKGDIVYLHKAFGILVIFLMVGRIIARLFSKRPEYPTYLKKWELLLAKITQYSLYIIALFIPISGYIFVTAAGREVDFFGINLPILLEKNDVIRNLFREYHEIAAYIAIALIALHVIGFLKHLIIDKTNLIKRII